VLGDHLAALATQPSLDATQVAVFDRLLTETPLGQRIVAFKVWSIDGQVLYSTTHRLMGQRFEVESGGLRRALLGEVSAELSNLGETENTYEREHWDRLLEVYTPIRQQDASGRVLAVVEFYQPPDEVEREVAAAHIQSWAVVGAVTAAIYLLLVGLVKRGSDTIDRHLRELATLHDRLRRAGARTTALNEQGLRRVSADLHDGPGQVLALALLKLDQLCATAECAKCTSARAEDVEVIRGALQESLTELRAIAAGLRLPHMETGDLGGFIERIVHDHQRRTGFSVDAAIAGVPCDVPLPIKIAVLRSLQEGLSNATRHGLGRDMRVRVWSEGSRLYMDVKDGGPGFDVASMRSTDRLGLAGMRERAELLGGTFSVESAPGNGTAIHFELPLQAREAPWPLDRA
jgi:signal transduction histidine kinase